MCEKNKDFLIFLKVMGFSPRFTAEAKELLVKEEKENAK
jgi:hypothetical protein